MAHALAADFGVGYFNAAAVAGDSFVLDLPVFAAVAFEILRRAENALTEKPVFFRLKRAVIDRLGFLNLAPRPAADYFRRCDAYCNRIKTFTSSKIWGSRVAILFLRLYGFFSRLWFVPAIA